MKKIGILAALGFIATVFGANWMIQRYGIVPVGFGLMAPAGVFVVGIAFTLRDVVHKTIGREAVLVCIVISAAASAFVSPTFALASACAFGVSETADLMVYQRMERRGWTVAVAASNAVGLVVDSALFLWLAFGSLAFMPGQVVGKAYMTLAAIAMIYFARALSGKRGDLECPQCDGRGMFRAVDVVRGTSHVFPNSEHWAKCSQCGATGRVPDPRSGVA